MRVTPQHWEEFLRVAGRNPSLITSKFNGAQGKAEGNALWTNVAAKLNALGFGEKSVAEWRRAVTDWKSKVKAKASKLRISSSETGGGPVDTTPLTPLENKLLILIGKKSFEGDQGIRELGMTAKRPTSTTNTDIATKCNFYKPASVLLPARASIPASASTLASSKPQNHGFGQIFKNTPQNLTDDNEPSAFSKPMDGDYEEEHQDHEYCGKRKIDHQNESSKENLTTPNANKLNKYKRMKISTIPRVSRHLEDMTSESVEILRNIEANTSRIADSFEKLVKHFVEKQE